MQISEEELKLCIYRAEQVLVELKAIAKPKPAIPAKPEPLPEQTIKELQALRLRERDNRGVPGNPEYIANLGNDAETTYKNTMLAEQNDRFRRQLQEEQATVEELRKQLAAAHEERNKAATALADREVKIGSGSPTEPKTVVERYVRLVKFATPLVEEVLVQWARSQSRYALVPGLSPSLDNGGTLFDYDKIALYIMGQLSDGAETRSEADRRNIYNRIVAVLLLARMQENP